MQFYASPEEEAVAVRRAAARAGCRVRALEVRAMTLGAPIRVTSSLACADGWMAGKLLLALAVEDARTPGAAELAAELRAVAPSDEAFARALHAYVLARVRFKREESESFESGGYTLEQGEGDCDAHFRLIYAVAVAGGLPAGLVLLHHGKGSQPAHALAALGVDGEAYFAETSVPARFGEEPNAAALRLGLTDDRTDIAKEVVIMTENDLAPLPTGFRSRNSAEQTLRDAEALERLGYLDCSVPTIMRADPTATPLRLAVHAFQRGRGLVADGLLGPTTRLVLARALADAGPPVNQGFDYAGLSGLGDQTAATQRTAHITPMFLQLVRAMAERFRAKGAQITARDLLSVWLAESGIRNIRNHQGAPFGGINQMGPTERRNAGFGGTFEEWLAMPLEAQLPYVERYYINATAGNFSRYLDAQALYLANFAPAHMAHADDPDHIIFSRNPAGPTPNAPAAEWEAWRATHKGDPYAWNLGLDVTKDGTIRVGELGAVLRAAERANGAYWSEVVSRLGAVEPPSSPAGIGGGVAAAAGAVLLLGAAVGAAVYGSSWWAS